MPPVGSLPYPLLCDSCYDRQEKIKEMKGVLFADKDLCKECQKRLAIFKEIRSMSKALERYPLLKND